MAKDLENKINKNSISLAGEFAVLSQLALRGYDANMTLGHTKSVDILVSNPKNHQMYQLEVKTNFASSRSQGSNSKLFGKIVSAWIMGDKHETITSPNLPATIFSPSLYVPSPGRWSIPSASILLFY